MGILLITSIDNLKTGLLSPNIQNKTIRLELWVGVVKIL
jgi:hypothetical protein